MRVTVDCVRVRDGVTTGSPHRSKRSADVSRLRPVVVALSHHRAGVRWRLRSPVNEKCDAALEFESARSRGRPECLADPAGAVTGRPRTALMPRSSRATSPADREHSQSVVSPNHGPVMSCSGPAVLPLALRPRTGSVWVTGNSQVDRGAHWMNIEGCSRAAARSKTPSLPSAQARLSAYPCKTYRRVWRASGPHRTFLGRASRSTKTISFRPVTDADALGATGPLSHDSPTGYLACQPARPRDLATPRRPDRHG